MTNMEDYLCKYSLFAVAEVQDWISVTSPTNTNELKRSVLH